MIHGSDFFYLLGLFIYNLNRTPNPNPSMLLTLKKIPRISTKNYQLLIIVNFFKFLNPEEKFQPSCIEIWLPRFRHGRCVAIRLWNRFCEKPYSWISCIILRYYPWIYFYTHFWNPNLWKKFFDTKKFIFEGWFS